MFTYGALRLVIIAAFFSLVLMWPRNVRADNLGIVLTTTPPARSILLLNLPRVYILPGSPLYNVVEFWRKAQLFLAKTDQQKKLELTSLAELKLAEAIELWQKGELNPRLFVAALTQYRDYFNRAQQLAGQSDALARLLNQQQLLEQALAASDPSLARLTARVLGAASTSAKPAPGRGQGSIQLTPLGRESH